MRPSIASLAAVAAALWIASSVASGAGDDNVDQSASRNDAPQASRVVRQDSLELPGVTACHQCEWRPHLHEQAAADQCGVGPDGKAKVAQFECGFSPDCDRVCNFLSCLP